MLNFSRGRGGGGFESKVFEDQKPVLLSRPAWIRTDFGGPDTDPNTGGQNDPLKFKKCKNFKF
jgi:hypothetical protein